MLGIYTQHVGQGGGGAEGSRPVDVAFPTDRTDRTDRGASAPPSLWEEQLISSRLLEYEIWVRIHSYGLAASHGAAVAALLQRVALVELVPALLARAREPFPGPVRTLDALHLATAEFLRGQGEVVVIASYDDRLVGAARGLGFEMAGV